MHDRENVVEKYLVDRLDAIGVPAIKFMPDHRVGMPDRLVLLPDSRVVWVELKTDNGALSPMQKFRHSELNKLGQTVAVVWNKDQADTFVDSVKARISSI